jgi:hypothetical protein
MRERRFINVYKYSVLETEPNRGQKKSRRKNAEDIALMSHHDAPPNHRRRFHERHLGAAKISAQGHSLAETSQPH